MNVWREFSYGKSDEPFARQISYDQSRRIYNLFCERLSYTRTRSAPLRRKIPPEEKKRFMETIYGAVARDEDTGRAMFAGIPSEYIDQFHQAKAWYETLREKSRLLESTLSGQWDRKEILAITGDCGAQMSGQVKYYDPVHKKEMAMLVFGIGMKEVNRLRVPSLEAETLYFGKNVEIQNMTNRIGEKIWEKGIHCDPVPVATYYHLDNLEFNQVRFCQEAFAGCLGKNFLFLSREFGPKFRMGQIILPLPPGMKFPRPKKVDFCRGCTICVDACPSKALKIDDVIVCSRYFMSHDHCSICMDVCPIGKE